MKKTINIKFRVLMCTCAVLFLGTWGLSSGAFSAQKVQLSQSVSAEARVAAVESEENYTPAIVPRTSDENDADYEGTAIVGIKNAEISEPAELTEPRIPATGVEVAIIPAAIALIALVLSFVIGKFIKKK